MGFTPSRDAGWWFTVWPCLVAGLFASTLFIGGAANNFSDKEKNLFRTL